MAKGGGREQDQTITLEKRANRKNGIMRMTFAIFAICLEILLVVGMFLTGLDRYAELIAVASRILALFLVLGIYSQNKTPSIKMPWIILILVFPALGVSLYLLIGLSGSTARMKKRFEKMDELLMPYLQQEEDALKELGERDSSCLGVSQYLVRESGYPLYRNEGLSYYPEAIEGLEAQKQAMEQARSFIFMEYFAIEDGESWGEIEEILVRKAKEGVEVRVFYDDFGSIGFINTDFARKLEKEGIHCRIFNPMIPFFNLFLNNRDHRKMTIVDGRVGFTGGYNLANEYFNRTSPYGYWKDTGVRLTGPVVRAMTVTFLEMWNAVRSGKGEKEDFASYLLLEEKKEGKIKGEGQAEKEASKSQALAGEKRGFVQFYADNPMDRKPVGEDVYLSILCRAKSYVYIMTPYLIITDEMSRMLGLAAKRGVDVRIITPGIPDKKMVYQLTRSYYARLVQEGVRIYEYTPGFCHAKMCVSDDVIATCGTINMDYRSLYHHFEDGCLMLDCEGVLSIREDMENTFPLCQEVTEQYKSGRSAALRLGQLVLRLFAPLM